MRIEQRAVRVSLVSGLSTLLGIGFQLISVPVCLKYWGPELYGSWLSLYAASMLVRSLDTGFVTYVGNKLNYLYHGDIGVLRAHLASSLSGIVILASLELAIALLALVSGSFMASLGLSADRAAGHRTSLALLVLVATWAISGSYLGIVNRLLIPAGLLYQASWWSMGFQFCQFVAIIIAAVLRFDLLSTSILFAAIQMVIYVASADYVRRKVPECYPWLRGIRVSVGLRDLGSSMLLAASNLIQQGSTNGALLLVSALAGPAMVPVFTTVRTVANLWTNVTNVLTTPLLPEVVRYHARNEGQKLVSVCQAYWVVVGSGVNLGVLATYPLIQPVYASWTSHKVVLESSLLSLLLAGVVLANVGGLMALYVNGINSLRIVLLASGARGVLGLAGGSLLFRRFGLAGFGLGILAGELAALLFTGHYFVRRALPEKGVGFPAVFFAPITVSTSAVLLFLMSVGLGLPVASRIYPIAIVVSAATALWGWKDLPVDVKNRFKGAIGRRPAEISGL